MRLPRFVLLLTAMLTSVITAQGIILCVENDGTMAIERAVVGSCRQSESVSTSACMGLDDHCAECVDRDMVDASLAGKVAAAADLLHKFSAVRVAAPPVFRETALIEIRKSGRLIVDRVVATPPQLRLMRGVVLRC